MNSFLSSGAVRALHLSKVAWRDRGQIRWLSSLNQELAYLGWIDRGNLGDEAMFSLQKSILHGRSYRTIPLDRTTRRVALARRPLIETLVIGGGTLLGRDAWAEKLRDLSGLAKVNQLVVLGAGVEDREFGLQRGVTTSAGLAEWQRLLSVAAFVGVRGPRSQRTLSELGVTSEVVGDPALSIPVPWNVPGPDLSEPIVAVNVAAVRDGYTRGDFAHLADLGSILTDLTRDGVRVVLFGMERADMDLMREQLAPRVNSAFLVHPRSVRELTYLLGRSSLVVSERLHGGIIAANLRKPHVMIGYKPKNYDFVDSINNPGAIVRQDSCGGAEFASLLQAGLTSGRVAKEVETRIDELSALFAIAHRQYL